MSKSLFEFSRLYDKLPMYRPGWTDWCFYMDLFIAGKTYKLDNGCYCTEVTCFRGSALFPLIIILLPTEEALFLLTLSLLIKFE